MGKRIYEDYAKANCIPIGYNEAVTQYIFGQSTVDMLLDKIDVLDKALELLAQDYISFTDEVEITGIMEYVIKQAEKELKND